MEESAINDIKNMAARIIDKIQQNYNSESIDLLINTLNDEQLELLDAGLEKLNLTRKYFARVNKQLSSLHDEINMKGDEVLKFSKTVQDNFNKNKLEIQKDKRENEKILDNIHNERKMLEECNTNIIEQRKILENYIKIVAEKRELLRTNDEIENAKSEIENNKVKFNEYQIDCEKKLRLQEDKIKNKIKNDKLLFENERNEKLIELQMRENQLNEKENELTYRENKVREQEVYHTNKKRDFHFFKGYMSLEDELNDTDKKINEDEIHKLIREKDLQIASLKSQISPKHDKQVNCCPIC
jgi:hypothetical protein